MNKKVFYTGLGLVGIGIIPSPDDVTIVSPAVQIGLGSVLMVVGYLMK